MVVKFCSSFDWIMSVYVSVLCLSGCLSVWLSVCLIVCLPVCPYVFLSVCLSVCLFVCLSVCESVCFSVFSLHVDCFIVFLTQLLFVFLKSECLYNILFRLHVHTSKSLLMQRISSHCIIQLLLLMH